MVEQIYSFSPSSSKFSNYFENIFETSGLEIVFPEEFKKSKPPSLIIPQNIQGAKAQRLEDYNIPLEKGFAHLLEDPSLFSPVTLFSASDFTGLYQNNLPEAVPEKIIKPKKKEPVLKSKIETQEDMSRQWVSSQSSSFEPSEIKVLWKTRNHENRVVLPDILYSSMKYEFKVSIPIKDFNYPYLLGKVELIDASTNKVEKDALTGTTQCAFSKEKGFYVGKFITQKSNTVSYYHTKKDFFYEFRFYDPQEVTNQDAFFVSIKSPHFRTYSRKPNKLDSKEKKK